MKKLSKEVCMFVQKFHQMSLIDDAITWLQWNVNQLKGSFGIFSIV